MAGRKGGAIGGAMDLAIGARRVYIANGAHDQAGNLSPENALRSPITAAGRMTALMTNLGLFVPKGDHFLLREIAHGWTVEEIKTRTDAP
jgi:acyl CoA:acetate/3-ketoacid CoA transferase beta subunit